MTPNILDALKRYEEQQRRQKLERIKKLANALEAHLERWNANQKIIDEIKQRNHCT